jgi:hypothetical protein
MDLRASFTFFFALGLSALPACGGGTTGTTDAASRLDAGSDASAANDAGSSLDAGSSVDAGSSIDGGSSIDAGTSVDAGSSVDANVDASVVGNGVHCVGATADCAPGQVCCGGSIGVTCQDPDAICTGEALACDGTEDCPGARCCSTALGTECAASCTGYHLCHDASECGAGEGCCPNGGGIPAGALSHCTALPAGTSCPLPP